MLEGLKNKARLLKAEVYAIYLAYKDPRVPWYARIIAICVVGYAFSPIDLILVPLGIALTLKMIPKEVMAEYREQARVTMHQGKPVNCVAAIVIIGIWIVLGIFTVGIVSKHFIA